MKLPGAILPILASVVILRVVGTIVAAYPSYFPPDFDADFLRGREGHFFGPYRWAFTVHLMAGPVALVLGLALVSRPIRDRWPAWHRRLGWVQVPVVVGLVAPSGLIMATRAASGPIAGVGLGVSAVFAAASSLIGVRCAIRGQITAHRRWMIRCFLLLAATVVLRLSVGLMVVLGVTTSLVDILATWLSWIGPLAVFEGAERIARRQRRPPT